MPINVRITKRTVTRNPVHMVKGMPRSSGLYLPCGITRGVKDINVRTKKIKIQIVQPGFCFFIRFSLGLPQR